MKDFLKKLPIILLALLIVLASYWWRKNLPSAPSKIEPYCEVDTTNTDHRPSLFTERIMIRFVAKKDDWYWVDVAYNADTVTVQNLAD